MLTKSRTFISVVSFLLVLAAVSMAAESQGPTLLVIPARHTIVKLSFDIAMLRTVSLVTYSGDVTAEPLIHIWRSDAQEWVETSIEEYRSAGIFKVAPRRIILIGSDKDLPSALIRASTWCSDVKRIPTLDIVTIANSLHESLKFAPREWKWLSKRYDLKIEDLNAERRRYGKYGKPGEEKNVPLPPAREKVSDRPESSGKVEIPLERVEPRAGVPDVKEPEWEKILPENK